MIIEKKIIYKIDLEELIKKLRIKAKIKKVEYKDGLLVIEGEQIRRSRKKKVEQPQEQPQP